MSAASAHWPAWHETTALELFAPLLSLPGPLLPALHANASLRSLRLRDGGFGGGGGFVAWSGSVSPPSSPQPTTRDALQPSLSAAGRALAEERALDALLMQAEQMVSERGA